MGCRVGVEEGGENGSTGLLGTVGAVYEQEKEKVNGKWSGDGRLGLERWRV